MYFDVLDSGSQDIVDPDTGEPLGSLSRPRIRVRINHVQSLLSVGITYRKTKVNIGGAGPNLQIHPLSRALLPEKWITRYETLESNGPFKDLDEKDSIVKVGDPVVQVEVDDE